MSQLTVPIRDAIRQASQQRREQFEALAAYANLGDAPESWRRFRLAWPDFFRVSASGIDRSRFENLTEWLYASAEDRARFYAENAASLPPDAKTRTIPPLLWYRDLLRAVWTRNDKLGAALCALLGFEDQARRAGVNKVVPTAVMRPLLMPDQSIADEHSTNGLPPGQPVVDGIACTIRWDFGCQFQRAVYELMQNPWLAKVCPQCGKFFIAGKTAQKFCSSQCCGKKKASASLDFYYRKGRSLREGRRKSLKRLVKKRGGL